MESGTDEWLERRLMTPTRAAALAAELLGKRRTARGPRADSASAREAARRAQREEAAAEAAKAAKAASASQTAVADAGGDRDEALLEAMRAAPHGVRARDAITLIDLGDASSTGCKVFDTQTGRYELNISVTKAGRYTVQPFINRDAVAPPHPFTVRPAELCATSCKLVLGSSRGTTGRWVPLTVEGRDAYGNLVEEDGHNSPPRKQAWLEADGDDGGIEGEGGVDVTVIGGEGRTLPVEYLGNGMYEGAVVSPVACLLRVAVTIRGEHVPKSPFELQVHAGRTSPPQTYGTGDGWQRRVPLNRVVSFVIHAHDAQGNPQSRPVDTFLITLTPRQRGNHAQQLRGTYLGGGETEVRYELTKPGSYVLSVTTRGYHIKDSPFNLVSGDAKLTDHLAQPRRALAEPGAGGKARGGTGTARRPSSVSVSRVQGQLAATRSRAASRAAALEPAAEPRLESRRLEYEPSGGKAAASFLKAWLEESGAVVEGGEEGGGASAARRSVDFRVPLVQKNAQAAAKRATFRPPVPSTAQRSQVRALAGSLSRGALRDATSGPAGDAHLGAARARFK